MDISQASEPEQPYKLRKRVSDMSYAMLSNNGLMHFIQIGDIKYRVIPEPYELHEAREAERIAGREIIDWGHPPSMYDEPAFSRFLKDRDAYNEARTIVDKLEGQEK